MKPAPEPIRTADLLHDYAIMLLNAVKAWRDSEGNEDFPEHLRLQIDGLIEAVELAEKIPPASKTPFVVLLEKKTIQVAQQISFRLETAVPDAWRFRSEGNESAWGYSDRYIPDTWGMSSLIAEELYTRDTVLKLIAKE